MNVSVCKGHIQKTKKLGKIKTEIQTNIRNSVRLLYLNSRLVLFNVRSVETLNIASQSVCKNVKMLW